MAFSISKTELIGNLGRDVEIKTIPATGSTVAVLNLATSESWKDKNTQEWVTDTEWHRVVFYGAPADALAGLQLRKGESLYVSGRIKSRKWIDEKTQIERTVYEIIGDTFVPHRQQQQQQQQRAPQQQQQRAPQQQQQQQRAPQQQQQRAPQQQQQRAPQQQQAGNGYQQPYDPEGSFEKDDIPF